MNSIKIGWAMRDVSTTMALNMPGQFYMRVTKESLDPLTVTCLVLENEEDIAVFLSGDFIDCRCHLLDELREAVRTLCPLFPVEKILVNATHTHTGASHLDGLGSISIAQGATFPHPGIQIDPAHEYRRFLVSQMAAAVKEAYENRCEGGIAYGYGFASVGFPRRVAFFDDLSLRERGEEKNNLHGVNGHVKMYGNTSDPMFSHYEGGGDPFVNLMFTFDAEEKLTGAIINIPCPSQCSETESFYSADYWHDVRLAIREKYGDIFILPQCAAAGDLSPRLLHYRKAQERRFRLKYGTVETKAQRKDRIALRREIAGFVLAAFDDVYSWAKKEIFWDPKLVHCVKQIHLPRRIISEEEYESAKEGLAKENAKEFVLDQTPEENFKINSMIMSARGRYLKVIKKYEDQKRCATLPMELHAVRVGEIAFASNQFELFLDYQHRIQARSPFVQTFVVQLAAQPDLDNATYLPTERALEGRGFGASIYDNLVSPEGGQVIVEESLAALCQLAEQEN